MLPYTIGLLFTVVVIKKRFIVGQGIRKIKTEVTEVTKERFHEFQDLRNPPFVLVFVLQREAQSCGIERRVNLVSDLLRDAIIVVYICK